MYASPSVWSNTARAVPKHAYGYLLCFSLYTYAVVLDAYPNTATMKQGSTLVLVCRVVGVPSTTMLSYQWSCPGGSCDAGAVDPEWAAKVQQGNILVVNVRRHDDGGSYNCTVWDSSQQVGADSYLLTVAGEYIHIQLAVALRRYNHRQDNRTTVCTLSISIPPGQHPCHTTSF